MNHDLDTYVAKEKSVQSIPARFEKIARQYPGRLAVKMGDRSLTYDAFNQAANRIARAILAKRGPGSEPIALLFEHGIDVLLALFGVLKAGKSYVAINSTFPPERMNTILEDSGTGLIVTNGRNPELARSLTSGARGLLNIDAIDGSLSSENLGLAISADDLLTILYTSGSTGEPKGVRYKHKSITHDPNAYFPIRVDDRVSLIHSVSFGSASTHLYQSLLNGASLFPFDLKSEGVQDLARWLGREEITMLHVPPAVFRQLAEPASLQDKLSYLRLLRLSGAPITKLDFDLYKKNFCSTTLLEIRMGSTESRGIGRAVVDQTFSFPEDGTPAGYPYPDNKIFLLDENGREVGPGEVGEIAVQGRTLSDGYWKRPEDNTAKFLRDPKTAEESICLTGDLGRMRPDGFLIHLGRKDFMVKIRGYRVELGEIERTLRAHPQVKEAGVVADDRQSGEKYLAAYVVAASSPGPTVDELRRFLKGTLPDYMMPSAFVFLGTLPLTNGKLDRKALPKADERRPELSQPYVAPRNEVERMLAEIWAEILSLDRVGVNDNFFDLGGHSLAATRVVSQVIEQFRLELPLQSLFQSPTIAEMAAVIDERQKNRLTEEELERILTELETMSEDEAKKLGGAHDK
ncbi:MAG TPA: non-ribosomal peptide synthetase [Candidatus Binatia bacterium]